MNNNNATKTPKFGIIPNGNDNTLANKGILWGVKEMNGDLTLTQFMDKTRADFGGVRGNKDTFVLRNENGGILSRCPVFAVKAGMTLIRAVILAAAAAEKFNGRLTGKCADIAKDESIWKVVEEIETLEEEKREIQARIRASVRRAEIAAMRGNIFALAGNGSEKAKHYTAQAESAELADINERLKSARIRERDYCAAYVASHFGNLAEVAN